MCTKPAALSIIVALGLGASDVSVGVLTLFRPDAISIHNPCATRGTLTVRDTYRCDQPSTFELEVPNRIRREFGGRLRVTKVNDTVTPVVSMDLETAVASVLAAEMPAGTPGEALKALAVVVRSFYLAAGRRHPGYDFCDTTHCQFLRAAPAEDHPAWRSVRETANVVITWNRAAFPAMHFAACGGRTFRAEEVGLSGSSYPYFGVQCDACARQAPSWKRTLAHDDAVPLLRERSENARLAIVRKHGWSALPGNNYRATLSSGAVVVEGKGAGHGVGLCQRGAAALAAEGASFREILRHYYPHTELGTVSSIAGAAK